MYKLKRFLFWAIWGTWFNDLKYSKFFDECWDREDIEY